MERDVQIDWAEIVEAARRRRKERKLSMRRLAALANVSLPTVLRFEKNQRDIQLSSVLAILNALGMVAKKIEGTLLLRRLEDGSPGHGSDPDVQVMFAPSAGAGRELERKTVTGGLPNLKALLGELGVGEEAQRLAAADLVRTGAASITGLELSGRHAKAHWPEQFGDA
ncbi:MAG: helix-turn-helix domain-containing protein [Acidobacteriia bacterium]|nr:helix-turn-helix domain-containing protein [Terriglobia bacterium]